MCSPWTGRDRRRRCRPGGRAGNPVRRGGALSGLRRYARPDRRRPGPGTATARGAGAAWIAGQPLRSCGPDLGPSGVLPGRARRRARCALPRDVRAAGDPRWAGVGRPAADRGPRRGGGRAGGAGGKQPRVRERGVPGGQALRGGGPHDPDRWAGPIARVARQGADRHGLEVVPGKLVWELRPAVPSDKGDAVRRVVTDSGARAVLVAGDDLGDLPAFVAASRLGDALRVAVQSAETPAPLLDAADVVVDGPQGLLDLLRRLAC